MMLDEHRREEAARHAGILDAVHNAMAPFWADKGHGKRAFDRTIDRLKDIIEYADLQRRG